MGAPAKYKTTEGQWFSQHPVFIHGRQNKAFVCLKEFASVGYCQWILIESFESIFIYILTQVGSVRSDKSECRDV